MLASRKKELFCIGALFLVTGFWGSTFVLIKDGLDALSPLTLMAWRFSFGAIALLPFCLFQIRKFRSTTAYLGLLLGLVLFLAFALQTYGLKFTTATNSAFLTGTNALMVPAVGFILYRMKVQTQTMVGIILAFFGSWLLFADANLKMNSGDLLTMGCALLFAWHIILLSRYGRSHDSLWLTFYQILGMALSAWVFVLSEGREIQVPALSKSWWLILYLGVVTTALTFLVQTYVQKFLSPSKVGLVFATEPLWGALFAFLLISEKLPPLGYMGGLLMVSGVVVAEWPRSVSKSG